MYLRKIKLVVLATMLFTLPAFSQSAFKGQLHISKESFSLQGSSLRVRLRISYDETLLARGESLNLTPVLKNKYNRSVLSSVVIMGKGVDTTRFRANVPIVLRDQFVKGVLSIDYDAAVPYEDWMDGAAFYLQTDERNRKGESHVYEDLVFDNLRIGLAPAATSEPSLAGQYPASAGSGPYNNNPSARAGFSGPQAMPEWIQFLEPAQPEDHGLVLTGVIPLADSRKIGSLNTRQFNEAVYRELRNVLREELSVPGTTIDMLSITGYGAPIGNYRQNETRCSARALELNSYILNRSGDAPNSLNISWVAEDWDGIRVLIENSDTRLRSAALDIIRNVDVPTGREDQLRMLGGGSFYSYLTNSVFPEVCRIEFSATLRREPVGSSINSERAVSLHSLYETAMRFAKGSREFNDLIDLSARLYPNFAEACINAAGVAMMRGDLNTAAFYMKGFETDPRAFNNLGVLYLLQGDTSKAEVYLLMANAAGVSEAGQVLATLKY